MAGRPHIVVLAGVNGAGKSSLLGHLLTDSGTDWFNPDAFAREVMNQIPGISVHDANARAWSYGHDKLKAAIADGTSYFFETTLGGETITRLLLHAVQTHDVMIMFCGLPSPEHLIRRVQARVTFGGHDIPVDKIQERWTTSRQNLIRIMPHLARLQVFDNGAEAEPGEDIPDPVLILHIEGTRRLYPVDLTDIARTPDWAKPLVEAALRLSSPT